ncbi:uncharacterized protein L969DRAFT_54771 [Mixia osmundae IAM 14324]|uniref:uncharacterized protein n=1 Tax=Mixia osmundae (strain CBS 9802 / IAM 14324 / JCM 22182 / KY 12970) TaxID=764103 RepID=UPI0004A553D0|nr:uncharacterized protein L969DRAFT_54771 [Mixia osmundae IAM 14324]KEI36461.1 hypothetical protein L969DRAFT_54771 [Mixia osmundae IAM 14324]
MRVQTLSDLNDYLGPSQICIKPVNEIIDPTPDPAQISSESKAWAATEIRLDEPTGHYYEIESRGKDKGGDQSAGALGVTGLQQQGNKLKKAEITLNDCLACSGCITSAESVLVNLQSHTEVYTVLQEQADDIVPVLSISPQSIASLSVLYSVSPQRTFNALARFFKRTLGFALVFDTDYARELSLAQGRREVLERWQSNAQADTGAHLPLPLLASACPGWICYAEKTHGELLPFISAVKSPQQIAGSLIKQYLVTRPHVEALLNTTSASEERPRGRRRIYHVSVMPCFDKKLEASRPDFADPITGERDVDCVLTTGEVHKMLQDHNVDLSSGDAERNAMQMDGDASSTSEIEDELLPRFTSSALGTSSGGYLFNALRAVAASLPSDQQSMLHLESRAVRGEDYIEYRLLFNGALIFRAAKCYGFRNLQNVVRKVGKDKGLAIGHGAARGSMEGPRARSKGLAAVRRARRNDRAGAREVVVDAAERSYDFIEVMACPSGCVNGGGQLPPSSARDHMQLDTEGMPQINLSDVSAVSGKDWVARVEAAYWDYTAQSQSDTLDDLFRNDDKQIEAALDEMIDSTRARQAELGKIQSAAQVRQEMLTTQYRAVEIEEINGLAVKW